MIVGEHLASNNNGEEFGSYGDDCIGEGEDDYYSDENRSHTEEEETGAMTLAEELMQLQNATDNGNNQMGENDEQLSFDVDNVDGS